MKKKVSIYDIAKHLNVSATTVSFVVNGKANEKRIGKELQEKILSYVKEIGYHPNLVAQSLRTGKSYIIGMLVEDISDPFFATVAKTIEAKAYHYGYKILYSSTENDIKKTAELIRTFQERQVDGYIIAPPIGIEKEITELLKDKVPVIFFDRYFPHIPTTNIVVDNFGGAYQAVNHFIKNGYKNIAIVTLKSEQTQMKARLEGYMKAIEEASFCPLICKLPYNIENEFVREKIEKFLSKNKSIDAIFFATNYIAIGGLEAIKTLKLSIPEDIAVIGFDDSTHFALFSPSISVIAQPVQEIANEVINKMLTFLKKSNNKNTPEEENTAIETTTLPTQLIIRESSQLSSKSKHYTEPDRTKVHIVQNNS